MCGIAAVLLHPQERTAEQWQAIGEAFTRNLLFNEERGNVATGIAVADRMGRLNIYKKAMAAARFVETEPYQEILRAVGPQTTLLIGHTRMSTKGDPARNANNHPIQAGSVVGVHNGEVTNDDDLFRRGPYERRGEVDSEIIFRLIESVDPGKATPQYLAKVRERIEAMQGQYTFVACDLRKPEHVLVLRHGNPLCMHYQREWNALVFSSRYVFLRKTFGTALTAGPLPHDQLMLFDSHRLTELAAGPCNAIPLSI